MRQTFTTAVHTLTRVPGSTLLDVIPLLTDPGFRRRILAQVKDDTGLEFWQHFDAMSPEQQSTTTMPVIRRLHSIQMRPSLRGILGQSQPKFDLRDLLTSRKILVVNLNKGIVGAEPARILGNLLVGMLWQQTLTRQRIPAERRHIVGLYIDEAQEFVGGLAGGNDLADMLAQARSLGLAVHLANQYLGQFTPKIQEAILTNTRNKIYLPLSQADARIATKDTSLDPADLTLLPAYHAQVRMVLRGQDSEWMTVKLNQAPRTTADSAEVYAASQTRYGMPVADVETARKQKQGARPRPRQSEQRPDLQGEFGGRSAP
ncbi:type IV secretory system conjugative DNA transfer family protein [Nesterenkonia muleiensis]|uniref:type IV secretory system conjugative DNA transfer family protein n=1 Tax=Nesterenkonia muleiensis TaxID=2282648 RepID=UPI000E7268E2|nr:type IV secretory system conjugative DNA transfer family protein [Nesterenkonia muleiensis]